MSDEASAPRSRPKYQAVRTRLIHLIESLGSGDRLPSERDLALEFGVSRMTIRHAITGLEQAGRVHRVTGSGTYVSHRTISKSHELSGFSEDMRARGMVPSSRVLRVTRTLSGADMGTALRVSPAEELWEIERVRLANGDPMCLERVHLPCSLVGELTAADVAGSLYDLLEARCGLRLVLAEQTVSATVLTQRQAELLDCPVLSPALVVRRVSHDWRHVAVEHAETVYRVDRYDIHMTIRRQPRT